ERAGQPRHRSHNPRGESERAGCDRINPSFGGCGHKLSGRVRARFSARMIRASRRRCVANNPIRAKAPATQVLVSGTGTTSNKPESSAIWVAEIPPKLKLARFPFPD